MERERERNVERVPSVTSGEELTEDDEGNTSALLHGSVEPASGPAWQSLKKASMRAASWIKALRSGSRVGSMGKPSGAVDGQNEEEGEEDDEERGRPETRSRGSTDLTGSAVAVGGATAKAKDWKDEGLAETRTIESQGSMETPSLQ